MVAKLKKSGSFQNCAVSLVCRNVNVLTSGISLFFHIIFDHKLELPFLKPNARYSLKNAMKPYSQMAPRTRKERLLDYNRRLCSTAESMQVIKEWDLDLEKRLIEFDGHRLKSERLLFGASREHE